MSRGTRGPSSLEKEQEIRISIAELAGRFADLHAKKSLHDQKINNPLVARSSLSETELQYMIEAVLDGHLMGDRFRKAFQQNLAHFIGVKHVIAVNSIFSANLLALNTLCSSKLGSRAITPGDEVLAIAVESFRTINPILHIGAVPVLVDIDIPTYNVDVSAMRNAISPKTKAVMLAHTLGNPFDIAQVKQLCEDNHLWLIEDCSDALGARYNSKTVGTFGDISTLGFHDTSHITTGDGGAVVTNNDELKSIIDEFISQNLKSGYGIFDGKSEEVKITTNLKNSSVVNDSAFDIKPLSYIRGITEVQAACGVAQLQEAELIINERLSKFTILHQHMKEIEDHCELPEATDSSRPSWLGYPISLKSKSAKMKEKMVSIMRKWGMPIQVLAPDDIIQQISSLKKCKINGSLHHTKYVAKNTFWIELCPSLSGDMLSRVAQDIYFQMRTR